MIDQNSCPTMWDIILNTHACKTLFYMTQMTVSSNDRARSI